MREIYFYNTKIGEIAIVSSENKLVEIILNPSKFDRHEKNGDKTIEGKKILSEGIILKETKIIKEMWTQIEEYLQGHRKIFTMEYDFVGTEFQKSVWRALLTIPYGETKSYKEISELVERPKAFRAVGMANHLNPLPIIIPCHRVIGSNGDLVGYGGGLFIKKYLLDLEHKNCK